MESSQEPSSGQKIAESTKVHFDYCPFCGGKVEEAKTNTPETCVWPDCGQKYTVLKR